MFDILSVRFDRLLLARQLMGASVFFWLFESRELQAGQLQSVHAQILHAISFQKLTFESLAIPLA